VPAVLGHDERLHRHVEVISELLEQAHVDRRDGIWRLLGAFAQTGRVRQAAVFVAHFGAFPRLDRQPFRTDSLPHFFAMNGHGVVCLETKFHPSRTDVDHSYADQFVHFFVRGNHDRFTALPSKH